MNFVLQLVENNSMILRNKLTISTSVALVAALMLLATEVYSGGEGEENTAYGNDGAVDSGKHCVSAHAAGIAEVSA